MSMQMCFSWQGQGNDSICLSDIRRIPGVTGIVWALHGKLSGTVFLNGQILYVDGGILAYIGKQP